MFADVIVDIQHEKLDKIFQYRIPERLKDELYPGLEVIIPFGKGNRQIKGYVTSLSETCKGEGDYRHFQKQCGNRSETDRAGGMDERAVWRNDDPGA